MARAMWSGVISFSLVNIPVRLFSAVRDRSVHLKMLSEDGRCRLRRKMVCPETNKEYGYHEAARGFEIEPDQFVLVSEDEIEQIRPEITRAIDIRGFIDLNEVDPIYYDRPYYLAPDEKGARAYLLLLEALEESGKAALVKFVMHRKEYLAILRPKDGVICLETMHYPDEIVELPEIPGLPSSTSAAPGEREKRITRQLIDSMSTRFEPSEYRDDYREALLELIQRKSEGQEIVVQEPEPVEAAPVIDLMEALEQSLRERGSERASRKQVSGRRPRSRRSAAKGRRKRGA